MAQYWVHHFAFVKHIRLTMKFLIFLVIFPQNLKDTINA